MNKILSNKSLEKKAKRYRGSVLGGHSEEHFSPNDIAVIKSIGAAYAENDIDLYNGGYSGAMRWSSEAFSEEKKHSDIWSVGFPIEMVGYDMNGYGNSIRARNLRQRDLILTRYMDFVFAGFGGGGTKRELNSALDGRWPNDSEDELNINLPDKTSAQKGITIDDLLSSKDTTNTREVHDRTIIVYGIENAAIVLDYLKDAYNRDELLDRLYYIPDLDDTFNDTYTYNFHRGTLSEIIQCIKKRDGLDDVRTAFLEDYRFDTQILSDRRQYDSVMNFIVNDLQKVWGDTCE